MKEEEMNLRQAHQPGMPDDVEKQSLSFLESEGLKLLTDFQRIVDAKVRTLLLNWCTTLRMRLNTNESPPLQFTGAALFLGNSIVSTARPE